MKNRCVHSVQAWVSLVDVAVLGGSVSLLTGGIVFPSVAVGSHDRIGMWSLKISLLAHERPKELV